MKNNISGKFKRQTLKTPSIQLILGSLIITHPES